MSTTRAKPRGRKLQSLIPGLQDAPSESANNDEISEALNFGDNLHAAAPEAGVEQEVKQRRGASVAASIERRPPAEVAAIPPETVEKKRIGALDILLAPPRAIGWLLQLVWFCIFSVFYYIYLVDVMALSGLRKFTNYALRKQDAPSQYETGKNLFWLLFVVLVTWLFLSGLTRLPSLSQTTVSSSGVVIDDSAVKSVRTELRHDIDALKQELKKVAVKLGDTSALSDITAKYTEAIEVANKKMKDVLDIQINQISGKFETAHSSIENMQKELAELSKKIASFDGIDQRQKAAIEKAVKDLDTKLVGLMDERDTKLRNEMKQMEQKFVTLVGTKSGEVKVIQPDESKITEISRSVVQEFMAKHKADIQPAAAATINEDSVKNLVRDFLGKDSNLIKTLYDSHIKSQVQHEAANTAAEVTNHILASYTPAETEAAKPAEAAPVETKPVEQTQQQQPNYVYVTKDEVASMIADRLELHAMGGVAMADYALRRAGASIVHSMTSYQHFPIPTDSALKKIASYVFPPAPRAGPEEALKPVIAPSDCWPFYGNNANVTIQLSCPIKPTHVTIDHVHPALTPHSSSAPKSFKIWGIPQLAGPATKSILLGEYEYDINAKQPVQTFAIQNPVDTWMPYVKLEITDNWGYWYTCLYRFRVHGVESDACSSKI